MGNFIVTSIVTEKLQRAPFRFGHQDNASRETPRNSVEGLPTLPSSSVKAGGSSTTSSPWRGRLVWIASLLGVSGLVAFDGYHRAGQLQRKHQADLTELKRTLESHQADSLAREKKLREDFLHRLEVIDTLAKNREHMMDLAWTTRLKKHQALIEQHFENLAEWLAELERQQDQVKAQWEAEKKQSDSKFAEALKNQADALEGNHKSLRTLSTKMADLSADIKQMQASLQAQQQQIEAVMQGQTAQVKNQDEMDRKVSLVAAAQEKSQAAQKDLDLARAKQLKSLTDQMVNLETRLQGLQKQMVEVQHRMPLVLPPGGRLVLPGRICP